MRPRALIALSATMLAANVAVSVRSQQGPDGVPMPPARHEAATVGGRTHDGVDITVDLPESQHVKNFGAPADGKGLCVFASADMAARWSNVRALEGIIRKVNEGGGWPEKVDRVMEEHAPEVQYVQYEGTDASILDKAMREGRPACVTYGYGERYNGQTIYHMVLLVHLDGQYACILDNNFPGEKNYEWMSRDEFLRRWVHPQGQGWAFVLLTPPPPPVPRN